MIKHVLFIPIWSKRAKMKYIIYRGTHILHRYTCVFHIIECHTALSVTYGIFRDFLVNPG